MKHQRGAALPMTLIFLFVLTVLGISALRTTSLEQRMALNVQEVRRAFEAAESGLGNAFNNPAALILNGIETDSVYFGSPSDGSYATAQWNTNFVGWSPPPRGSGYSELEFQSAHFDTVATGAGAVGASATLHQGVYQITPKIER